MDPNRSNAAYNATPPPRSSLFGLISNVNKGKLASQPKSILKKTAPVAQNTLTDDWEWEESNTSDDQPVGVQKALAVADKLSSMTQFATMQKRNNAFLAAKSTIEQIQLGLWKPPRSERDTIQKEALAAEEKSKLFTARKPGSSMSSGHSARQSERPGLGYGSGTSQTVSPFPVQSNVYKQAVSNYSTSSVGAGIALAGAPTSSAFKLPLPVSKPPVLKTLVDYDDDDIEEETRKANLIEEKALEEIDKYRFVKPVKKTQKTKYSQEKDSADRLGNKYNFRPEEDQKSESKRTYTEEDYIGRRFKEDVEHKHERYSHQERETCERGEEDAHKRVGDFIDPSCRRDSYDTRDQRPSRQYSPEVFDYGHTYQSASSAEKSDASRGSSGLNSKAFENYETSNSYDNYWQNADNQSSALSPEQQRTSYESQFERNSYSQHSDLSSNAAVSYQQESQAFQAGPPSYEQHGAYTYNMGEHFEPARKLPAVQTRPEQNNPMMQKEVYVSPEYYDESNLNYGGQNEAYSNTLGGGFNQYQTSQYDQHGASSAANSFPILNTAQAVSSQSTAGSGDSSMLYEDFLFGGDEGTRETGKVRGTDDEKRRESGYRSRDSSAKSHSRKSRDSNRREHSHSKSKDSRSKRSEKPAAAFTCKDCSVSFSDEDQYNTHLQTDSHLLTLQQKAAELFQMSTKKTPRKSRFDTDTSGLAIPGLIPPVQLAPAMPMMAGGVVGVALPGQLPSNTIIPSMVPNQYSLGAGVKVYPPTPRGPLEIMSVRITRMRIAWHRPTVAEEGQIEKYVVEYRNARETQWVRAGETREYEFQLEGLKGSTDYLLRVCSILGTEKSEYLESVLVSTLVDRGNTKESRRSRSSEKEHRNGSRDRQRDRDRSRDDNKSSSRREREGGRDKKRKERDRSKDAEEDTSKDAKAAKRHSAGVKRDEPSNEQTEMVQAAVTTDEAGGMEVEEFGDMLDGLEEALSKEFCGDSQNMDVQGQAVVEMVEEAQEVEETVEELKVEEKKTECLLYQEFGDKINEPLIGLEYISEVQSHQPNAPTTYNCKLCTTKGVSTTMVNHMQGYNHKLEYMKKHKPILYDGIMMLPTKKARTERLMYEAKHIEDTEGRGAVSVNKMLNPEDHDGKIKFALPELVQAPVPVRPAVKEPPGRADIVDLKMESHFDLLVDEFSQRGMGDGILIGLNHINEFLHPEHTELPRYKCNLCNVLCSPGTVVFHVTGKKHRMAYLKAKLPDVYNAVFNSKDKTLLQTTVAEIAAEHQGQVRIIQAKKDKMWQHDRRGDHTSYQPDLSSKEEPVKVKVDKTEKGSNLKENKSTKELQPIKFVVKKTENQSPFRPLPGPVLEGKSKDRKDEFDWTKENAELQAKIQNQSVIKCARQSKFLTVYSDFFANYPVVGMQWITEFQRPDPKVEPWYMCFMCQQKISWKSIIDHVTSNTHRLNYVKKNYSTKYKYLYNIVSKDKTKMGPMLEQMARQIAKDEETLTHVEVMLELNINKEALKSVMKVKENKKSSTTSPSVTKTTSSTVSSADVGTQPDEARVDLTSTSVAAATQAISGLSSSNTYLSSASVQASVQAQPLIATVPNFMQLQSASDVQVSYSQVNAVATIATVGAGLISAAPGMTSASWPSIQQVYDQSPGMIPSEMPLMSLSQSLPFQQSAPLPIQPGAGLLGSAPMQWLGTTPGEPLSVSSSLPFQNPTQSYEQIALQQQVVSAVAGPSGIEQVIQQQAQQVLTEHILQSGRFPLSGNDVSEFNERDLKNCGKNERRSRFSAGDKRPNSVGDSSDVTKRYRRERESQEREAHSVRGHRDLERDRRWNEDRSRSPDRRRSRSSERRESLHRSDSPGSDRSSHRHRSRDENPDRMVKLKQMERVVTLLEKHTGSNRRVGRADYGNDVEVYYDDDSDQYDDSPYTRSISPSQVDSLLQSCIDREDGDRHNFSDMGNVDVEYVDDGDDRYRELSDGREQRRDERSFRHDGRSRDGRRSERGDRDISRDRYDINEVRHDRDDTYRHCEDRSDRHRQRGDRSERSNRQSRFDEHVDDRNMNRITDCDDNSLERDDRYSSRDSRRRSSPSRDDPDRRWRDDQQDDYREHEYEGRSGTPEQDRSRHDHDRDDFINRAGRIDERTQRGRGFGDNRDIWTHEDTSDARDHSRGGQYYEGDNINEGHIGDTSWNVGDQLPDPSREEIDRLLMKASSVMKGNRGGNHGPQGLAIQGCSERGSAGRGGRGARGRRVRGGGQGSDMGRGAHSGRGLNQGFRGHPRGQKGDRGGRGRGRGRRP